MGSCVCVLVCVVVFTLKCCLFVLCVFHGVCVPVLVFWFVFECVVCLCCVLCDCVVCCVGFVGNALCVSRVAVVVSVICS